MKSKGKKQGDNQVCNRSNTPHFRSSKDSKIHALNDGLRHCRPTTTRLAKELAKRLKCNLYQLYGHG